MSGPTHYTTRADDTITVHIYAPRNSRRAATAAAATVLTVGEQLGEPRQDSRTWTFPVVPAVVLSLGEVLGTPAFPRGTKFVVVPPAAKQAA